MKNIAYIFLLTSLLTVFSFVSPRMLPGQDTGGTDPRISIEPVVVAQGDPFTVHVMSSKEPTGAFDGKVLGFASCGTGCYQAIAIAPLDIPQGDYKVKVNVGKGVETADVGVLNGDFRSQSLTLPPDKVNLSPEDEARTDREAAMLRAMWAERSDPVWEGPFIMPLKGGFSTEFGVRRTINNSRLSIHSGVDIRGAEGTPIRAANTGTVVVAEDLFYGGNTLVLDHGQGVYTVYMHMKEFRASLNELVSKGEAIGLVGSTGRSTGPHLHYTVKVYGQNANPTAMAGLPLLMDQRTAPKTAGKAR